MKTLNTGCKYHILAFVVLLFLASCSNKKTTPFPENPSGFRIPVAKPFKLPAAKPLQWKDIPMDSIPKGITIAFDLNKLPFKPFSINDFEPLKSPVSSKPLNWNKLEEININLDTLKNKPVLVKKFRLPDPIVTRVNPPAKWEGTTSGILKLGQAEGLLGNQVYSMVTDALGSIWISTENGISKYNGNVFETYNFFAKGQEGYLEPITDLQIDNKGNLLITGFISGIYKLNEDSRIVEHYQVGSGFIRIHQDHDGRIWTTNFNRGIFFLDSTCQSISHLILPKNKIDTTGFSGLFEDSQHNLWIGFRNELAIVNPKRNSLRLIGKAEGLDMIIPYKFTEDFQKNIWISTFTKETKYISLAESKIYTLGAKQGFSGNCLDVVQDPMKRIWIIGFDTAFIFDQASNRIKKIPTGSKFVDTHPAKALIDFYGTVWIGTANNGILLVDSRGTLSEHFNTTNGLASNDVWGIREDKYKRVWLATYKGINIYDPDKQKLFLLKLPENLSSNNHRRLDLLDDDHMYIGSEGGFSIIDFKRNKVTVYKVNRAIASLFWSAYKDSIGDIWISSDNGVIKFNPDKSVMKKIDVTSGLMSNTVWFFGIDNQRKMWLTTDRGINVIDLKENTILNVSKKDGLVMDIGYIVCNTHKGELVIGGDKGFSLIDPQRKWITNVTAKEGLIPETMYDFIEVNGRINIGSEKGLIIVDQPKSADKPWKYLNYGKSEGFPSNNYNQAIATYTSKGNLWLSAAPVLSVTLQDPLTDTIVPKAFITDFNIMDQNPSFLDLKRMNSQLSKGDTLWNADLTKYTIKNAFPKDSGYLSQHNITWDNLSASFHMPIGLKLPYDQNSFNFSFTNPDIKGRDKIVYRYILEGAKETWSEVSPKTVSKNYYNIKPGEYTFKVATRGFNGVWSKPVELNFTIRPPWWQTWWAYCIYGILFIVAVLIVDRFQKQRLIRIERGKAQIRELAQAKEIEKAYTELKTTQSQLIQSEKMASLGELTAGIAHEIQNPLNFVNNFSEVNSELIEELEQEIEKGNMLEVKALAKDIKENEQKINHHGKRADAIVKGMLQHSRSSSGVKESSDINALADEYLRLAYHGLRAKDKSFNATLKTDFDESIGKIDIIPQDMGRVILNLITNAFYVVDEKKKQMHSGYEPTVSVSTKKSNGNVEIKVTDNGNGIPQKVLDKIFQPFFTTKPTGEGTGLGLSLAYDIVKAHGGELKVATKEGEGTSFIIQIPRN